MLKITLQKLGNFFNEIISRNTMIKSINGIIDNNSLIRDHERIADSFKAFYANVGKNLAAKLPVPNRNFKEYLNTNILDSIFFKPTDDIEI